MKYHFVRGDRIWVIVCWYVIGLLVVVNSLTAMDTGWATALFRWGKYAIPLSILTYFVLRKTPGALSPRALWGLPIAWLCMGSITYVMQYGPFDWIVRFASAPRTSVQFTLFDSVDRMFALGELLFGLVLCWWMIRQTRRALRADAPSDGGHLPTTDH